MDGWDVITIWPMVDFERDGIGGIDAMLHNENGARNGVAGGTPSPLAGDMGGQIERQPLSLGMVEVGFEENDIFRTIAMMMWWGEKDALSVIETS